MDNKLNVGIIGMGNFGKTHLSILNSLERVNVVAVADLNEEALAEIKHSGAVKKTYTSALDLAKDPDIDMIDIVTDENSHGELVEMALDHGKHVFVEKPLTKSAKHGEILVRKAAEKNLRVMTGNSISRFSQPYYMLKKNQELMGDIVSIRSKRNVKREWFKEYGHRVHVVYETGIHDIDLAIWFAESKCKRVYAVERNISGYDVPDAYIAMLEFENGVVANIESSWFVPNGSPITSMDGFQKGTLDIECEVIGTKQTAKIDLSNNRAFSIWAQEEVQHPEFTLWPDEFGHIGGATKKMISEFVNELYENRPNEYVKLEDSVQGLKICEAIIHSAADKKIVTL